MSANNTILCYNHNEKGVLLYEKKNALRIIQK